MSKKVSEELVEEITGKYNSLNSDYLTEKEIKRAEKFIFDLYGMNGHLGYQLGEYNSFKSYVESLKYKIEKRENIPFWYINNKYKEI